MMPELDSSTDLLAEVRGRIDRLQGKRDELVAQQTDLNVRLTGINTYLAIADSVTNALEQLSNDVFQRELSVIESTLTKALQEVLDQPVVFRATASFKRDAASVEFSIEREGNPEDIMRGQGGSVANVVSVGLRMFAITTLDERRHRKFLVLDEQDCWLRPDLVPNLVRIVRSAARALKIQVILISHHDEAAFSQFADRIYLFQPHPDGIRVEMRDPRNEPEA